VIEYGPWAFRDATNVIESLYILVGFFLGNDSIGLSRFFIWEKNMIMYAWIYGATYPARGFFQALSPTITAGAGHQVRIFFEYVNSSIILLWCACGIIIFSKEMKIPRSVCYFISFSLLSIAVYFFQARTVYLQVIGIMTLFLLYRRDLFRKSIVGIILCLLCLALISWLGLAIKGRLGQEISIDFFINHVFAIFGISNQGVEGAARGVDLRIFWWKEIYYQLMSSLDNLIFGLGYGFPLVDLHSLSDIPVREPHNSYISFVARSGLIGLALFFVVHFQLFRIWHWSYINCKKKLWVNGQNQLIILMVYFVLVIVLALGEDGFEKPYNAIPYYFFWGIVLRIAYNLKHGNISADSF
jgi:hypothetical protein